MSADDDFILDISDVPTPPEAKVASVEDEIKGGAKPAFKLCFLGLGQGGGRIAQQFWQYGYRRVCAANTAIADIEPLELPKERKLIVGAGGGAGGSTDMGAKLLEEHREDIYDLARTSFVADFDRIIVTVTAGGGTGSGGVFEAVKIAHDLIDKLELRNDDPTDPQVGVIIALPKEVDGKEAHLAAAETLQSLMGLSMGTPARKRAKATGPRISPLIIIDNQRIDRLYPNTPTGKFWGVANHAVCSLIHLLNLVSARESQYTSFDKKDFEAILRSGLVVFGSMPVPDWEKREGISVALRNNLDKNLLVSGMDIKTGKIAGCVIVASKDILDNKLPQENIDEGLAMLGRTIQGEGAVRHGIYAGNGDGVAVYTMIGGLAPPAGRIAQLRKLGGLSDWDGA